MAASGKSKGSSPSNKANKGDNTTTTRAKSSRSRKSSPPKNDSGTTTTQAKKRRRSSGSNKKTAAAATKANNKKAANAEQTQVGTPYPTSILVVDNGGDTLKYGWIDNGTTAASASAPATSEPPSPQRLPNVTARLKHQWTILVGDELYNGSVVQNPNQMHFITRSTERGIITNLGNQIQVWKRMLDLLGVVIPNLDHSEAAQTFGWKKTNKAARPGSKAAKQQQSTAAASAVAEPKILASQMAVLLLVPPHCPRGILDQIMFTWMEDFGVSHVGFATTQICATKPHPDYQSGCLVDIGWSATHIVPTFRGTTIQAPKSNNDNDNEDKKGSSKEEDDTKLLQATSSSSCPIRRIPLGGRQLVNIWKYYCSYRQWNLMDQEQILRDVFEKLGYVSLDFQQEIEEARQIPQGRRPFDRNFVLPDYQTTYRGHVELTEALKRQKAAEEERQRKKQQQQQQEGEDEGDDDDDDDEEEDEDFEDDKIEEDVELEADDNVGDNENQELEEAESKDEKEEGSGTEDKEEEEKEGKKGKKRKKSSQKKRKRKDDNNNSNDGEDDTDDDDSDDDDDDDDNKEMMRQRLLRQKQEEERRRKELEAEQQVLTVSVERFTVPEVLFLPSDAGLPVEMAGLAHSIVQSIKACPRYLQPALFRSIQLTGGVAQLTNLMERLQRDLRALAPAQFEVQVTMADKPIDQAWMGARDWAQKHPYTQWSVSRDEWEAGQKRKAWMKLLVSKGGLLV